LSIFPLMTLSVCVEIQTVQIAISLIGQVLSVIVNNNNLCHTAKMLTASEVSSLLSEELTRV
jgi:hypothetical protein